MAVRFGKTVRGGKTHLVVTSATGTTVIACPYAARKPFLVRIGANGKPNPIKAHEVKAADVCHWCRRQDNLTAAWRLNVFGETGYSMALETLLLNVEVVRTVRQEWERAIEAANSRQSMEGDTSRALVGAVLKPQVVEAPAEPQRTAFAAAAIRAGARLERPRKPVRAKSRNVLAKIHNSFAVAPKTKVA